MRLAWIEVRDFRNHEDTRLELPDGVAVAVGGNGEGKTNLLEAVHYLLALSSPRTSSDLPLVRHGAVAAYLRGEVEGRAGRALLEVEVQPSRANRVHLNRSPLRRRSDVREVARAVFFGPGDLEVVQGDPDARRGFMDEAVVGLWPRRERAARAYEKALRQRNRLLKDWDGRGSPPGLEAWDAELVEHGVLVIQARAEAVKRVAPRSAEEFRALTGYGLEVRYGPSVGEGVAPAELAAAFRERLAERRGDELVRRVTLVGPHRDDLHVGVRDLVARAFASHGEAWAAALSLRLGLASAVTEEWGEPPVLLLDDPFAALDPARQDRLAERVAGRGQTLLSLADPSHIVAEASVVWEVARGRVAERRPGSRSGAAGPEGPPVGRGPGT